MCEANWRQIVVEEKKIGRLLRTQPLEEYLTLDIEFGKLLRFEGKFGPQKYTEKTPIFQEV